MITAKSLISYKDDRGELYPCWRARDHDLEFVEDRFSRSKRGVIRGFHGDSTTWKLCTCIYGSLRLVLWDINSEHRQEFILTDENKKQILVPPYFLNAHECLSDECILYYKWSENYSGPENQWAVSYKDKQINSSWFTDNPILSARDKEASSLEDLMKIL
jgi:dTDP-4-dehydrorhamnose 3,5-epimerase